MYVAPCWTMARTTGRGNRSSNSHRRVRGKTVRLSLVTGMRDGKGRVGCDCLTVTSATVSVTVGYGHVTGRSYTSPYLAWSLAIGVRVLKPACMAGTKKTVPSKTRHAAPRVPKTRAHDSKNRARDR